ncbi:MULTISPECIES: hypothetical protein [Methylobacterium]|jgi:hypothetical protein|uniref:Uncharacterized protein n=1 Tax=Methylobacterium aquaticum TaxID=270351 RepID=A0A0C6F8S4_9HYPH|nr:hypothetical protein [Methylobacterium aquaticum]BAQ49191.1 hypothetical protein Maq22A_1p34645 [Methylobacterium aquaticum]
MTDEVQAEGLDEPDKLPEIPTVTLNGDFFDRVATVPYTQMSLLMAVGQLGEGGDHILIPFVETKLGRAVSEDAEPEDLFSQLLTLENAAFLISHLAGDMRMACTHLGNMAQGPLRPEPARMEYVRRFLLRAQENVSACLAEMDEGGAT